jgi:hypothetical protein
MSIASWAPTLAAAGISVLWAAAALWSSSKHNRVAVERQADVEKHKTDRADWAAFTGQLQTRLKDVEKIAGETHTQVTNGHSTNMRDDLTTVIDQLNALGTDIRVLRGDVSGIGGDMRELRTDLSTLEQRFAESQSQP